MMRKYAPVNAKAYFAHILHFITSDAASFAFIAYMPMVAFLVLNGIPKQ